MYIKGLESNTGNIGDCGPMEAISLPMQLVVSAGAKAAMPPLRRILSNSPDLAEPLNFLAEAEIGAGHYKEAESAAREMVLVQTGKAAATDRCFGASHLLWAQALAGQHRHKEALPHAQIADRPLAMNAVSPGVKAKTANAHRLLVDLQGRVATK